MCGAGLFRCGGPGGRVRARSLDARKEDDVQAVAGVEMHAKPGDRVVAGQPLFTLHTATPERFDRALEALDGAVDYSEAAPDLPGIILGRLD